ncbi:MAG: hypothetical protein KBF88_15785 [Polyangiaceae bacterium]|nr:hypothetical protein [Polyangiaceae bacterium]
MTLPENDPTDRAKDDAGKRTDVVIPGSAADIGVQLASYAIFGALLLVHAWIGGRQLASARAIDPLAKDRLMEMPVVMGVLLSGLLLAPSLPRILVPAPFLRSTASYDGSATVHSGWRFSRGIWAAVAAAGIGVALATHLLLTKLDAPEFIGQTNVGNVLLVVFIVGVPALAIVPMIRRIRAQKAFAYFRLVDGKTGSPFAGAEVFAITVSHGRATTGAVDFSGRAVVNPAAPSGEEHTLIGTLDEKGEFRGEFGHGDVGALLVKAKGINSGLIGIESISEYRKYPGAPYECTVVGGMIAPPKRASPISRGHGP